MKDLDFTSLEVWKASHQLMLDVYALLKLLPSNEKYNRIDQLRRSVSSIPSNIAEGHGRYYYLENISFCRIARGSLSESKNHLLAIHDLQQADSNQCLELIERCNKIRKMLNGYIEYLLTKKYGFDK